MGQTLHSCATTTQAVRRSLQASTLSLTALAKRHGINPKTVAKWRKRSTTTDAPMGPKVPRSTVLSTEEEALIVAFRRHTLLPLDDCLYALQPTIAHLSRSALHRCLQRHGISRLPLEGTPLDEPKKRFKAYPIGFVHIDFAEVRTAEGKIYLFVAIDRTSKWVHAEIFDTANQQTAATFLRRVIEAFPYRIETVLTDNGVQFTNRPSDRLALATLFARVCHEHGIEHRLTRPNHPWTNGQVERMNRTLKEATVKQYHYERHAQLREHLAAFVLAYLYAKRLKTLKGLTPYEHVVAAWQKEPDRFHQDPIHLTPGLYT